MAEKNFRGLHVETTSISGAHSQHVTLHSLLARELQQFNRLAAGPVCKYKVVTSDATFGDVVSDATLAAIRQVDPAVLRVVHITPQGDPAQSR